MLATLGLASVSFQAAVAVVVACLLVGLALIAVEVLLVPGVGVPGIMGSACILFAFAFALWTEGPLLGVGVLAAASLILYLGARVVGFSVGHRLILTGDLGVAEADPREELLGTRGTAISYLRPSGIARFGVKRVDVVSRSEYLERGTPVVVVEVGQGRVVVERDDGSGGA